jgi:hypothetical protein
MKCFAICQSNSVNVTIQEPLAYYCVLAHELTQYAQSIGYYTNGRHDQGMSVLTHFLNQVSCVLVPGPPTS